MFETVFSLVQGASAFWVEGEVWMLGYRAFSYQIKFLFTVLGAFVE